MKNESHQLVINCGRETIHINEFGIVFPTSLKTLEGILGKSSRREVVGRTNARVYLWDHLGIYCSSPNPDNLLMLMLVLNNEFGLGHQPKYNFKGSILIDGKPFEKNTDKITSKRPYIFRSIFKNNLLVAIALGWNPDNRD